MSITSWILSTGEKIGSKMLSKLFWPPCSAMTLIIEDGRVLAVRTDRYLMLPGGIMEMNEDFRQCAARETKEETGLEVEILRELESDVKSFGGVEKIFLAKVTGGELQGSWEGEPEWIPVDEVSEEEWRWNRDIERLIENQNSK